MIKVIFIIMFSTIIVVASNNKEKDWYKPTVNTSWYWQLTGKIDIKKDAKIYDIDLFETTKKQIKELHKRNKKVICYFSAGTYENWRSDKKLFPEEIMGKNLDDWPGEKWIDIRNKKIKKIIRSRLNQASEKKCDGVEADNVDGYENNTGFKLTYKDQINFNLFIAKEAHKRGLSIGLKNDIDQIDDLEPFFDFIINEQCNEYDECDKLTTFIKNNKPVFIAEYNQKYKTKNKDKLNKLCEFSKNNKYKTLVLSRDLDGSFIFVCKAR